jgi:hemolysin activation/secretion protein
VLLSSLNAGLVSAQAFDVEGTRGSSDLLPLSEDGEASREINSRDNRSSPLLQGTQSSVQSTFTPLTAPQVNSISTNLNPQLFTEAPVSPHSSQVAQIPSVPPAARPLPNVQNRPIPLPQQPDRTKPPSQEPIAPPLPTPLPPPEELLESPSSIPPTPPAIPGKVPENIVVDRFEFEGNTAISNEELAAATASFTKRPISFAELFQARSAVTELYIKRGYITSGALIPPQKLESGVVKIQVIEGGLEGINVTGTQRLNPNYVRSRLAIATDKPLNRDRLLEALQLLQLNPLIQNISAELAAGTEPGIKFARGASQRGRNF